MPKKPKSIKVLGQKIKIEYIPPSEEKYGEFHAEKMLIEVVDNSDWQSHLLHEVIHAILFISGTEFALEDGQIEAIVRALEHGLKSLIRFK